MLLNPVSPLPCARPYRIVCAGCGATVSTEFDLAGIMSRPIRKEYQNTQGFKCEVLTVASATNVAPTTEPTSDFTWFEGYAWSVVQCLRCSAHLGWKYSAVSPEVDPLSFFGLIADRVAKADPCD